MIDAARVTFFDGLLWYLETSNWAFEKIKACPVGSQQLDIKMHHYLYFSNLFGAIDLVRNYSAKSGSSSDIENAILQHFQTTDDYRYARELRNSIVHRGIDPAAAGHADETVIYVLCPSGVTDRSGERNIKCSFKYTVELAACCNQIVNPVILEFLERNGFFSLGTTTINKEEALKNVRDSTAIPDWVKAMTVQAFEVMDLDQMATTIAETRIKRVRELLASS